MHEIRAFNRDWATVKQHPATRRVPGSVTVQALTPVTDARVRPLLAVAALAACGGTGRWPRRASRRIGACPRPGNRELRHPAGDWSGQAAMKARGV